MIIGLFREIGGNMIRVQQGLKELVDYAYSIRQNMSARVETSTLEDSTNIWSTWLDSRTMNLYGGVNDDNRHRFKIDHDFDLSRVINADVASDGSISLEESDYMQSQGTEFIIIAKADINGANADYAIMADKYQGIRNQLSKGNYKADDLEKAGGFKISTRLTQKEVENDGWLELSVGKNNASKEEYQAAYEFLKTYISKAQDNSCFLYGKGMGFFVRTDVIGYNVRPWCVHNFISRAFADDRDHFNYFGGRFLRELDKSAS